MPSAYCAVPRLEHQSGAAGLGGAGRQGIRDAASVGPIKPEEKDSAVSSRRGRLHSIASSVETLPKKAVPQPFLATHPIDWARLRHSVIEVLR